jgi:hypothetical protein
MYRFGYVREIICCGCGTACSLPSVLNVQFHGGGRNPDQW